MQAKVPGCPTSATGLRITKGGEPESTYTRRRWFCKRSKEGVINLLTTVSGTAWKQVEPIAEWASEGTSQGKDGGFTRVEQLRSFEKFFYSLSRRYDQTLMLFCAEHREALREVEKHGVKLPRDRRMVDARKKWSVTRPETPGSKPMWLQPGGEQS